MKKPTNIRRFVLLISMPDSTQVSKLCRILDQYGYSWWDGVSLQEVGAESRRRREGMRRKIGSYNNYALKLYTDAKGVTGGRLEFYQDKHANDSLVLVKDTAFLKNPSHYIGSGDKVGGEDYDGDVRPAGGLLRINKPEQVQRGAEVTCRIDGVEILDGILAVEANGDIFVVHNNSNPQSHGIWTPLARAYNKKYAYRIHTPKDPARFCSKDQYCAELVCKNNIVKENSDMKTGKIYVKTAVLEMINQAEQKYNAKQAEIKKVNIEELATNAYNKAFAKLDLANNPRMNASARVRLENTDADEVPCLKIEEMYLDARVFDKYRNQVRLLKDEFDSGDINFCPLGLLGEADMTDTYSYTGAEVSFRLCTA